MYETDATKFTKNKHENLSKSISKYRFQQNTLYTYLCVYACACVGEREKEIFPWSA